MMGSTGEFLSKYDLPQRAFKDEIDPNLPDTCQKPVPICAKQLRSGQIYSNDNQPVKATYYQAQTVGSQPVYYQTGAPNTSFRVYDQHYQRGDGFSDEIIFLESFEEPEIRRNFVKRVYAILSVQLLVTLGFICICVFDEDVREYVKKMLWVCALPCNSLEVTIYFLLICYREIRRTFPINFILLGILTASFAYITGVFSCMYSTYVVLMSVAITAAICISISLCACQTTFDITKWVSLLCFIIYVSFIYIITLMIIQIYLRLKIIDIIIAVIIGLLFCMYLVYDTQMIMGGRRMELSPEEYIFGALTLFVDVMQILWTVMRIFGALFNR